MWPFGKKRIKVGLALGGGGARGLAHVGVLKILEEAQFPIDLIVGTSAGSLVGAMYAQLGSADAVEDRFAEFMATRHYRELLLRRFSRKLEAENFFGQIASRIRGRIVINLAYSRKGLFKRNHMRKVIEKLLDEQDIDALPVPFAAVAVDLVTSREIIFRSGSVRDAVEASSSLPGYFNPVERDGQVLVDGAVLQVVPTIATRELGADLVVAVNVSQKLPPNPILENTMDIMFRASSVLNDRYNECLLKEADIVLVPGVGEIHWADFERYPECIEKGKAVARKALPLLWEKLETMKRRLPRLWRSEPEEKVVAIQE